VLAVQFVPHEWITYRRTTGSLGAKYAKQQASVGAQKKMARNCLATTFNDKMYINSLEKKGNDYHVIEIFSSTILSR